MEKGIKAGYDFYTHDYYGFSWSLAIIVYCIYKMKNYYVETNKQPQKIRLVVGILVKVYNFFNNDITVFFLLQQQKKDAP